MRNGIIFGTAMVEKKIEDGKVRCSAAYPTGREFGKEPYHIDRITGVCPSRPRPGEGSERDVQLRQHLVCIDSASSGDADSRSDK